MVDIAYLSFSTTTLELDAELINEYLELARLKNLLPPRFDLYNQLRFALCRVLATSIRPTIYQEPTAKMQRISFLHQFITDSGFLEKYLRDQGIAVQSGYLTSLT